MNRFVELFWLVFAKLLMEYAYRDFVFPVFGYDGFELVDSIDAYIQGWLLYLFGYLVVLSKRHAPLFIVFHLLFFIYVLPNIVYFSLSGQSLEHLLILILPFFIVLLFLKKSASLQFRGLPHGKPIILLIALFVSTIVVANSVISTGGETVLSYANEYEYRQLHDDSTTGGIFGYLNNWVAYIFVVLLLCWSIERKKLIIFGFCLGIILALFLFTGHKGVLQSVLLVMFFYLLSKCRNKRTFMLGCFCLLMLLIFFITHYYENIYAASLIFRRLLFVPAFLNFTYIDYFVDKEFVLWSNSVLKLFIQYPFDLKPVDLIATHLGRGTGSNTGFISAGFMHFGYIGVVIYTLAAVLIVNLINVFANRLNEFTLLSLSFLPLNVLFRSSDLFTTLLTHGLLLSFLVIFLYTHKIYVVKLGRINLYRI